MNLDLKLLLIYTNFRDDANFQILQLIHYLRFWFKNVVHVGGYQKGSVANNGSNFIPDSTLEEKTATARCFFLLGWAGVMFSQ